MSQRPIPKHVAIIMDGNGRWAQGRRLPRYRGHLEGVKRVEEIIGVASNIGLQVLTLYAFSTENWQRPKNEVRALLKLLCSVLEKKTKMLNEHNIRLSFIGQREDVPLDVLKSIDNSAANTRGNSGLILNIAFNYGSRVEILQAVKTIAREVKEGLLALSEVDEKLFGRMLYTRDLPDPDLLIRTSGEKRISNFLLWQISYSELYFTDKFWPEFDQEEFLKAIEAYRGRERRYGKVTAQK